MILIGSSMVPCEGLFHSSKYCEMIWWVTEEGTDGDLGPREHIGERKGGGLRIIETPFSEELL
jgi:hypothetical protein